MRRPLAATVLALGAALAPLGSSATAPASDRHAGVRTAVPSIGGESRDRARSVSARPPDSASRDAWDAFLAAHPGPWRAEWDSRSATPRQVWGAAFPLVARTADAREVERAVRALVDGELAPLARVPAARLKTAVLRADGDTWLVRLDRLAADGTPVAGAFVEVRLVGGRVVLLRLETHPGADAARASDARLSPEDAREAADAALRPFRTITRHAAGARARVAPARLVIAPVPAGDTWSYRPAWEVVSPTATGERWLTRVDARSGQPLSRRSLTPHVGGRVAALVEPRTVGDPLEEQPLRHLYVVSTAGMSATTGSDGAWSLADPGPIAVTLSMQGAFIDVSHAVSPSPAFERFDAAGEQADFVWSAASGNATQAELAAYVHANRVRAWALALRPDVAWLQTTLEVLVGVPGGCNAMWDGGIVLYGENAQCNDTARIADVVYHEFGHGLHQHGMVSGVLDPTVGEGAGDYIAATITGSPSIGPALLKDDPGGDGALREIATDLVWPDDLTNEVHDDGRIVAGAFWDLRGELIADRGAEAGRRLADELFVEVLSRGPTMEQSFVETLLADDDDGDLSNGTPNLCAIESAFLRHGLAGPSGLYDLVHDEVLGPVAAGDPIPITAMRPDYAALCAANEVVTATLFWGEDGTPASAPLTLAGEVFSGEIDGIRTGTAVPYWIEAQTADGFVFTAPPRAPENRFGFHVGPLVTLWKDDFETDAGWTSGGGGDDWEIGEPRGLAGDPDAAWSGTRVLGNDLSDDGLYADLADTWIESPPIDCTGCRDARLTFRRWTSVQQSVADDATILVNGIPVWSNDSATSYLYATPDDARWSFQEYDISEIADGEREIRIRFALSSDFVQEYGGWTVDDVAVVRPHGVPGDPGCGCSLAPRPRRSSRAVVMLAAFAALLTIRRRTRST